MADLLGMDPARIERLRSPERLSYLDPERVWDVLASVEAGVIVDIKLYDEAFHVFQIFTDLPESHEALSEIGRFFDQHIR